jgi:hypothetical protein
MLLRRNPVLVPGFADNNIFQNFVNINQSFFCGVVRKYFFGEIMSDLSQNFIYSKIWRLFFNERWSFNQKVFSMIFFIRLCQNYEMSMDCHGSISLSSEMPTETKKCIVT